MRYQVIVGNIGTVHDGDSHLAAVACWASYRDRSQAGLGRGAGESVVLMADDEIEREHHGAERGEV